jgi:hypothetical protein
MKRIPTIARHAALVRGEDGNLAIRSFETATQATAAARGREIAPNPGMPPILIQDGRQHWTVARLARTIGLTPRAIHHRCEAGELPHIDHGTEKRSRRLIPAWIADAVIRYGLRNVAARARAGTLIPSHE